MPRLKIGLVLVFFLHGCGNMPTGIGAAFDGCETIKSGCLLDQIQHCQEFHCRAVDQRGRHPNCPECDRPEDGRQFCQAKFNECLTVARGYPSGYGPGGRQSHCDRVRYDAKLQTGTLRAMYYTGHAGETPFASAVTNEWQLAPWESIAGVGSFLVPVAVAGHGNPLFRFETVPTSPRPGYSAQVWAVFKMTSRGWANVIDGTPPETISAGNSYRLTSPRTVVSDGWFINGRGMVDMDRYGTVPVPPDGVQLMIVTWWGNIYAPDRDNPSYIVFSPGSVKISSVFNIRQGETTSCLTPY